MKINCRFLSKIINFSLIFLVQIIFVGYSNANANPDNYFITHKKNLDSIFEKFRQHLTKYQDPFAFNKTVIDISNIVKDFDKQSSCDVKSWENKPENACICCLVKNAPELSKGKKPSEILNSCLKQYGCDISTILKAADLPYASKLSEGNIRDLIAKLYQQSIIVKEVSIHGVVLQSNGDFTEGSAIKFLSEAYQKGKLKNDAFKKGSCLKAKDIITEKGYQTKQLFLVTSECLGKKEDFIFKEIASGREEIKRLEKTFIIPELHPYLFPNRTPNFPSFVLPFAYISYSYKNNDHYMSLLERAPGILLSSMIKLYKSDTISKEDAEKAFYETGLALSNFHKHFMPLFKDKQQPGKLLNPTFIHGDAHQGNIFYDKATNQVIFIDNERIASESPKNPFEDISYSLFTTYRLFTPDNIKNDKKFFDDWILLSAKSFLKGYIDAYDGKDREEVLKELIFKFGDRASYLGNRYSEYLKYKNIFDKIFAELSSELK